MCHCLEWTRQLIDKKQAVDRQEAGSHGEHKEQKHKSPSQVKRNLDRQKEFERRFVKMENQEVSETISARKILKLKQFLWQPKLILLQIEKLKRNQLCLMTGHPAVSGTLEHQLQKCPALAETRKKSVSHWSNYLKDKPSLLPIVKHHTRVWCLTIGRYTLTPGLQGMKLHMELLLDPSTCPMVIQAVQSFGKGILSHLLYMTRTWCHSHHLKRRRLLKLYNII